MVFILSFSLIGYNVLTLITAAQSIKNSLNVEYLDKDSKKIASSLAFLLTTLRFSNKLNLIPKTWTRMIELDTEILFLGQNFSKLAGYDKTMNYLVCIGKNHSTRSSTFGYGVLSLKKLIPSPSNLSSNEEEQLSNCYSWLSKFTSKYVYPQVEYDNFTLDGVIWIETDAFKSLKKSLETPYSADSFETEIPTKLDRNFSYEIKKLWQVENLSNFDLNLLVSHFSRDQVKFWLLSPSMREELWKTMLKPAFNNN
jgi:hypothetical protein